MTFLPALITNTLLPLIALIFGFTLVSHFPSETLFWLQDKNWLPYPLLITAAVMASQFNQSRYFFTCLLWLLLFACTDVPPLINQPLSTSTLLIMVAGTTSLLIWQKDKGLRPANTLVNTGLIVMFCALLAWILTSSPIVSNTLYQAQSNHYAVMFPTTAQHYSLLEFALYMGFFLISSIRIVTTPQLNHSFLAATLVMLFILHTHSTLAMLAFAASVFALLTVMVVLLDSHNMAFKDELTAIPSRRALMHFTQSLFNHYTIVMADVDHFKSFNDKYGHDVGDQVLRMVAQQLHRVSKGGKAFRYGGEEFTLVFPGKKPEQVFAVIDALRESIAQYPMVIRQPDRPSDKPKEKIEKANKNKQIVHVTMSFGAAFKTKQLSFEKALKQADEALYKAKKAGRNNVQIAQG